MCIISYQQVRCRWPWGHSCLPVHTCTGTCCHSPTGQSPHTDQDSLHPLDQHDPLGAPLPPYLRDPLRHPAPPKSSPDLELLAYQPERPLWQKVGGVSARDFPLHLPHAIFMRVAPWQGYYRRVGCNVVLARTINIGDYHSSACQQSEKSTS